MSSIDISMMRLAIREAELSLENGNFPAGAVLVIDHVQIGLSRNQNRELGTWCNHAESTLLTRHSAEIKGAKVQGQKVEIYATLEPCLYCLGGLLQHRVDRLVYSVSDPQAGACDVLSHVKPWYIERAMTIESGLMVNEYLRLLLAYNEKHRKFDWHALATANRIHE